MKLKILELLQKGHFKISFTLKVIYALNIPRRKELGQTSFALPPSSTEEKGRVSLSPTRLLKGGGCN